MTNKKQIMLRLPEETHLKLKEIGAKERRSVNNLLEVIIEEYIKHYEQGD